MIVLRSAAFTTFFFVVTLTLLFAGWLFLWLPRPTFRRYIQLWPRIVYPAMKLLIGVDIEVRGRERVPPGPVIYASKHQSAWETMFFIWLNADTAYVMKKELTYIPFWGWYMRRCRHVVVDRTAGASAMRDMIRVAREILAEGRSIAIFPQGTRTAPGEGSERVPYHPGVAALYTQTGATVVPVALNSGMFWPRRSFIKRPGTLIVEFLDPIPPGMDRKVFAAVVEERIESRTRLLETQAGSA